MEYVILHTFLKAGKSFFLPFLKEIPTFLKEVSGEGIGIE